MTEEQFEAGRPIIEGLSRLRSALKHGVNVPPTFGFGYDVPEAVAKQFTAACVVDVQLQIDAELALLAAI